MSLGVRPVEESDRWTLLEWRNSDRVRAMSIDSAVIARDTHAVWFDRLLAERADEVLIVTWDDAPVGVVSLERVDRPQSVCSWGCHLGVTDVPPGVGAVLPVIGLGFGFDGHGMRRMTAQVLGGNRNMRGIHRRLGVPIEGTLREHVRRDDGTTSDVVLYGVLRPEWATIRATAAGLLPSALRGDLDALLDRSVAHSGRDAAR
jgi:UDP-4-amino-4,6-dideoxy-N-acetyl-beta-L-altrosamine N-acetyltransferase